MNIQETLLISVRSILANKIRSFLTMLGIIIGVGSVIAMISMGEGARIATTKRFSKLGSNLLYVRAGYGRRRRIRGAAGSSVKLRNKDVKELEKGGRNLTHISPEVNGSAQVVFRNKNMRTTIRGGYANWAIVNNFPVVSGRFFEKGENRARLRLAVVGQHIVQEVFGGEDPVGKKIKIKRIPFLIIGVLEKKGSTGRRNLDDVIIVPFFTAQTRLFGMGDKLSSINIQVSDTDSIPQAVDEITFLLRKSRKIKPNQESDFNIRNQQDIIKSIKETSTTFTLLLSGIAFVSLIVGGIGIMNIMLVSVTERTREIGLRKAVGAKERDILFQFLVEAVMLSLVGGVIGIIFGVGLSFIVAEVSAWGASVPVYAIIISFGFSFIIGVSSGYYPARKAALMNPIDALRYE